MDVWERCWERCAALLAAQGVSLPPGAREKLEAHARLVREWNKVAGLVSHRDEGRIERAHTMDSLSLAPIVARACGGKGRLVDIGSGGGFPAIPLKVALPGLDVRFIERSTRKLGFLRKAFPALGLDACVVVAGSLPEDMDLEGADVVTARAVEKPGPIVGAIAERLGPGAVFLCQSGDPSAQLAAVFHVEHVHDAWNEEGLRRGEVFVVHRGATLETQPRQA